MKDYSRHVVKAVIESEQGILFIHLPQKDVFELPGGGVEDNESPKEALKREIGEETGYVLKEIFSEIAVYEESLGNTTHLIHFYHCSVNNDQGSTRFTDKEIEAEMEPVWHNLNKAIEHNRAYIHQNAEFTDCSREKRTLDILIQYSQKIERSRTPSV